MVSNTETIAEQELLFPCTSFTVSVTEFMPTFEQLKVVGEMTGIRIPQASLEPLFTCAAVMETFPVPFRKTLRF